MFSLHRAVNERHLGYKNKELGVAQGNNFCLM